MTSIYRNVPSLGEPSVATNITHHLAEGPTWDPVRQRLFWVDIPAGAVYRGALTRAGSIQVEERFDFPGTASAVAISAGGDLLVAGATQLHYLSVDGSITSSRPIISGSGRRFNDGKADPAGRFVVGTKGLGGEEVLLLLDLDGSVRLIDSDLALSNGLGWSCDGRRFFSVDTGARRIWVRNYEPTTGESWERSVFLDLSEGYPDGLVVDAEDHVWVAVWGAGCVLRVSPAGEVVGRVHLPAPHVSSVTFAGPSLDVLVITSATEDMSSEELEQHPLAGRLFTLKTDVPGQQPQLWSGKRLHQNLEGTP